MSFYFFASSQNDSLLIMQKIQKLDKINTETKVLLKKTDQITKENQSLIYKIKVYVLKLLHKDKISESNQVKEQLNQSVGIKEKNINEPIIEIFIPTGYDTIRGNFFYRLFHKEKYYLRAYKL